MFSSPFFAAVIVMLFVYLWITHRIAGNFKKALVQYALAYKLEADIQNIALVQSLVLFKTYIKRSREVGYEDLLTSEHFTEQELAYMKAMLTERNS